MAIYLAYLSNVKLSTAQAVVEQLNFVNSLKLGTRTLLAQAAAWAKSPMGMITVAAVGVYGVVKLFDALTLSLAEAQEALDNSKKEYDESKEKLNSLGQQLNEVNTRIGELQGKGTLTIVEENELTKLKTVTEELKIQLEIQKELEKSKREELLVVE